MDVFGKSTVGLPALTFYTSVWFLLQSDGNNKYRYFDYQSPLFFLRENDCAFARKLLLLSPFFDSSGCDVVQILCRAISEMHCASRLFVYVGSDYRLSDGWIKW